MTSLKALKAVAVGGLKGNRRVGIGRAVQRGRNSLRRHRARTPSPVKSGALKSNLMETSESWCTIPSTSVKDLSGLVIVVDENDRTPTKALVNAGSADPTIPESFSAIRVLGYDTTFVMPESIPSMSFSRLLDEDLSLVSPPVGSLAISSSLYFDWVADGEPPGSTPVAGRIIVPQHAGFLKAQENQNPLMCSVNSSGLSDRTDIPSLFAIQQTFVDTPLRRPFKSTQGDTHRRLADAEASKMESRTDRGHRSTIGTSVWDTDQSNLSLEAAEVESVLRNYSEDSDNEKDGGEKERLLGISSPPRPLRRSTPQAFYRGDGL